MTDTMQTPQPVPLGQMYDEITRALERLLQKPAAHRPFVIIDDADTGKIFVQFAGSDGENFVYDSPLTQAQVHILIWPQSEDAVHRAIESAIAHAIRDLHALGLTDASLVRIHEEISLPREQAN